MNLSASATSFSGNDVKSRLSSLLALPIRMALGNSEVKKRKHERKEEAEKGKVMEQKEKGLRKRRMNKHPKSTFLILFRLN